MDKLIELSTVVKRDNRLAKKFLAFLDQKNKIFNEKSDRVKISIDENKFDTIEIKKNGDDEGILLYDDDKHAFLKKFSKEFPEFQENNYYNKFVFKNIFGHGKEISDIYYIDISLSVDDNEDYDWGDIKLPKSQPGFYFKNIDGSGFSEVFNKMKNTLYIRHDEDTEWHDPIMECGIVIFKDGTWLEDIWDDRMYRHEMMLFKPPYSITKHGKIDAGGRFEVCGNLNITFTEYL